MGATGVVGRAQSLETQALLPVAKLEMHGHQYTEGAAPDSVVARLRGIPTCEAPFRTAFAEATPVTARNIGKALACFERTLVTPGPPFGQYARGTTSALTA